MAVVSEAQFTNVVQPGLKKVFTNAFNEMAEQSLVGKMYGMTQSDKKDEDYLEVEDIGSVPEFDGNDLAYTTFKEGNSKTLTNTEYALGLKIQRKLIDDDLYGVVEDIITQMGETARYRMEVDAASPFVNAFNTTFTTFDSLSLCNSAHSYVSTSTTQSNSGSSALSYSAVDAAFIAMRKFTNSQDRFIFMNEPDILFVPVDLQSQAIEIVDSLLKPGTANNNANFYNKKFEVVSTPFLSDTDNWFLINSRRMKKFLIWQQRVPVEFANIRDFDTFVKKWSLYMRYKNAPLHWPWIYGNNV